MFKTYDLSLLASLGELPRRPGGAALLLLWLVASISILLLSLLLLLLLLLLLFIMHCYYYLLSWASCRGSEDPAVRRPCPRTPRARATMIILIMIMIMIMIMIIVIIMNILAFWDVYGRAEARTATYIMCCAAWESFRDQWMQGKSPDNTNTVRRGGLRCLSYIWKLCAVYVAPYVCRLIVAP